jgi:hypothetical protein
MIHLAGVTRIIFNEGIEQGRQEGLAKGLMLAIEFKFGKVGLELLPIIAELKPAKELSIFESRLKKAETVAELKKF